MNKKFESLKDAKFRTLESRELESVTAGSEGKSLDTITVYSDNTTYTDHGDAT